MANVADVLSGVQQLADSLGVAGQAVAKMQETATAASTGISAVADAAAAGAETITVMAAASEEAAAVAQSEVSELARLTEMLGSEEMARASLAARIVDNNAVSTASEEEVAASLERREAIMAEVTAREGERLAAQAEVTAATTASASQEVAAAATVHEAQQVGLSDATQAALLKTAAADAARNLAVQIEDLAQAQRNLSEIEANEPGNVALITRAQQELAAEAQSVAEAEKVATAAKIASAEASQKLAAAEQQASSAARAGTFAGKAQDIGQLMTMLGLVDPQLMRVGVGVQLVGQAAETLGPKIVEAGGGVAGFAAVLGPVVGIAAAVTVALTAVAAAAEFVGASFKAGIGEQESETTFAVLLGNVQNAKARLEELDATALKFHLDPDAVRDASAELTRFSQGALGSGDSLNMVIETAARSGQSLTTMGTIIGRLYETLQSGEPIGRMGTQLVKLGVISASDLNHLSNLQKEGAKGPEIWQAAEDALNKYSGAAEARANTFEGQIKGITTAWTETEEAFGRPIVDALTPLMTRVSQFLISLVPKAKEAGAEIGSAVKTIYGLVENGNLEESLENELTIAVDKGAVHFIEAFKDAWNQLLEVFKHPIDFLVTPHEQQGLAKFFGNNAMGGEVADGSDPLDLPQPDAAPAPAPEGAPTPPDETKSYEQRLQEEIAATQKRQADLNASAQGPGTTATTPNADAQFTTPDAGNVVTPDPKAVKARTQAVDEGAEAEKKYKMLLDVTNGALNAGDLSDAEATSQNIQTTKNYIASLEQLNSHLSSSSDKYQENIVRINAAKAALLTLAEGLKEYQDALALTKAELDAGIITQSQADAQDNRTISDYISRLTAVRAAVAPTSEKFQELTTKILEAQAALQKTTALGQITTQFHQVINAWGDLGKNASEWLNTSMTSGISTVSSGLTGLITKTGDWKQTFTSAIDSMLSGLIELGVKTVLHYAIMGAQMVAHAAIGESTTASVTATQVASGAAIAAAHAPAAAATSVSSYGVAAVVGAVLAIAAIGAIIALLAGGFAEGGLIPGSPSHSDNRIARVATGEYVIRTAAVQHWGSDFFDAVNNFRFPLAMPAFAAGGLVGGGAAVMAAAASRERDKIINEIKVGGPKLNLFQVNSRAAIHEAMRTSDGDAIIFDSISRQKHKMPFKK